MEDIALFILPNVDEDEETGGSKASVQVARLESKGKAGYLGSDAGSLGFSVSGGHEQNPLDFAKILADEEVGYAAKFSSWETKGEDGTSTTILRSNMSNPNNYTVGSDLPGWLNNQGDKLESPDEWIEKLGSPDEWMEKMKPLWNALDSQGKFFGNRDPVSTTPHVVRLDGRRIYLPVGRFHGVREMSEFTTYPPTQAKFSVDQIDDWECSALVPSDLAALFLQQCHNQVVPRRWSLGIDTLKVLVHPSLGGEFQKELYASLQDRIKGDVEIIETNDGYKPDSTVFMMNTDDNGRIGIAGSPSLIGYEGPVRGLDLTGVHIAQSAAKSAAVLAHLVRFRQILDLSNGAGQPDAPFKVTLKPELSKGERLARQGISFVFKNTAKSRLYFTILVLGSGFHVKQFYPSPDSPELVDEGGEVSLHFRVQIPDLLKDYEDQRDIIRIAVTRGRQVSWKSLELPDIWNRRMWNTDQLVNKPCGSEMDATTRSECSYWVEDIKVLSTKRSDGDKVYWMSHLAT